MKLLYRRCAGMDVHKKSISVCVRRRVRGGHFEVEEAILQARPECPESNVLGAPSIGEAAHCVKTELSVPGAGYRDLEVRAIPEDHGLAER